MTAAMSGYEWFIGHVIVLQGLLVIQRGSECFIEDVGDF